MTADFPFLFASDLDGTLLPNTGKPPEPGCLERTQALLQDLLEADCPVCVVSGRYRALAKQGQAAFRLSQPTWWICNVGTEVYDRTGAVDREWQSRLGPPLDREALRRALYKLSRLVPQEPQKQGPHKFSLYYPEPISRELWTEITYRIRAVRSDLQLVASVEEPTGRALLDIIPANAGKAHALWYIAKRYGLNGDRVFFAGDSGNDLDALLSGVCGVLVGNTRARPNQAEEERKRRENARLFVASACYATASSRASPLRLVAARCGRIETQARHRRYPCKSHSSATAIPYVTRRAGLAANAFTRRASRNSSYDWGTRYASTLDYGAERQSTRTSATAPRLPLSHGTRGLSAKEAMGPT